MRFPGPNDLRKVAEQGYEAAERAISLVPRLVAIVGEVEQLMAAVHTLVADITATNRRAAAVVARTETVVTRAEAVLGRTEEVTGALFPLADRFQPILDQLQPIAARLAATTSPREVDAVVKLIDTLPEITDKVRADIVPILDTLGTVAPDVRDLLDLAKELSEMLGAIPGLGRIKKKIEERQDQEAEYRADEVPPSAPDRQSNPDLPAGPKSPGPPG